MSVKKNKAHLDEVQESVAETAQAVQQDVKPLKEFVLKIYKDWDIHLAQALAFSLLSALVPIAMLLMGFSETFLGRLDPHVQKSLIDHVTRIFPAPLSSTDSQAISTAEHKLSAHSLILGGIGIVVAIIVGSRLFTLLEVCFDIIYALPPRTFIRKNLVALGMLLLFVLLIPIMIVASALPEIAYALVRDTTVRSSSNFLVSAVGIATSFIVSLILFEFIYVFVPHRPMSFSLLRTYVRKSWRGTLVAAVLFQLYIATFPIYAEDLLHGAVGGLGYALFLLLFLYLFSIILLLGAEINAFLAHQIGVPKGDLIARASKSYDE